MRIDELFEIPGMWDVHVVLHLASHNEVIGGGYSGVVRRRFSDFEVVSCSICDNILHIRVNQPTNSLN